MTNYEKIKNMSVKELAEFIYGTAINDCEYCCNGKCDDKNYCLDGHKQWLESEAENE